MTTLGFDDALRREGFPVPDNCREARLIVGVNAAMIIQYEVLVTNDDLTKLGMALQRMAQDA